jgi:hypothetical protein
MNLKTLIVGTTVCLGAVFNSCNEEKTVDFREEYIGDYAVVETTECYGPYNTCFSDKDTVITVSYGLTDTTLNVLDREVWLDSNGRFYDYHYELRLWNDRIYSRFMNGGLGLGQYETYEGYKIPH